MPIVLPPYPDVVQRIKRKASKDASEGRRQSPTHNRLRRPGDFVPVAFNRFHENQIFRRPQIREAANPFPNLATEERRVYRRPAHPLPVSQPLGRQICKSRASLEKRPRRRLVTSIDHVDPTFTLCVLARLLVPVFLY